MVLTVAVTSALDMSSRTQKITSKVFTAAIDRLHAGKATGSDRISNDGCKGNKESFAPVLARAFNHALETGTVARTFTQATVHCIPKVTNPSIGLDFRPITI